MASRTNSCLLHHSSVGQKSVFHVAWLILCFVLYKVELKVAARQFPSWRLWGWTHVQAHSGHWQEVLCCCRSELPVPSLEWFSASRGHPHPLSPVSFPPYLKLATVVQVPITLSISLTLHSDSCLFCLQPEKFFFRYFLL